MRLISAQREDTEWSAVGCLFGTEVTPKTGKRRLAVLAVQRQHFDFCADLCARDRKEGELPLKLLPPGRLRVAVAVDRPSLAVAANLGCCKKHEAILGAKNAK